MPIGNLKVDLLELPDRLERESDLTIVCWNVEDFTASGAASIDEVSDDFLDLYIGVIVGALQNVTRNHDAVVGFILEALGTNPALPVTLLRRAVDVYRDTNQIPPGEALSFEPAVYVGNIGHRRESVIVFHRGVTNLEARRDDDWHNEWWNQILLVNAEIQQRAAGAARDPNRVTRSVTTNTTRQFEVELFPGDPDGVARDPIFVRFNYDGSTYKVVAVHAPNPNTEISGRNVASVYSQVVLETYSDRADLVVGDFNLGGRNPPSGAFIESTRNVGATTLGRDGRHFSRHDRVYVKQELRQAVVSTALPPRDPTTGYEVSDHHIMIVTNFQRPSPGGAAPPPSLSSSSSAPSSSKKARVQEES